MKSAALDLLSEKPKRVRTPAAVPAAAAIAAPAAAPLPPAKKVLSLIDGEERSSAAGRWNRLRRWLQRKLRRWLKSRMGLWFRRLRPALLSFPGMTR
jgi:hypothetical protein